MVRSKGEEKGEKIFDPSFRSWVDRANKYGSGHSQTGAWASGQRVLLDLRRTEAKNFLAAESPEPSEPSPEAKSQPHVNFNVKL